MQTLSAQTVYYVQDWFEEHAASAYQGTAVFGTSIDNHSCGLVGEVTDWDIVEDEIERLLGLTALAR